MVLLLRRSWGVPLGDKPAFLQDFHAFLHGPTPEEVGHGPTSEKELWSSAMQKLCFSCFAPWAYS